MNVKLKTNTDDTRLEFIDLVKFGGDSGYGSDLVVEAHGFSGRIYFTFETSPMDKFIEQIVVMESTLQGTAVLQPMFEDSFLSMEMLTLGNILVSGHLVRHAGLTQQIGFEFVTDQTVFKPLIEDLFAVKNGALAL